MTPDDIRARIRAALPDADVSVTDTTGGGDHFDATVISSAFAGFGSASILSRHCRTRETDCSISSIRIQWRCQQSPITPTLAPSGVP